MAAASETGRRVVLVDDEPMVLAAIASFLALETQCAVSTFCCPHRALAHLIQHGADVVVADLSMPGLNGGQFIDSVKRLDPAIRLVLLSGTIDEGWREAMVHRGLDACLEKPWRNDELYAQIMAHAATGVEAEDPAAGS